MAAVAPASSVSLFSVTHCVGHLSAQIRLESVARLEAPLITDNTLGTVATVRRDFSSLDQLLWLAVDKALGHVRRNKT